MVIQQPPSHLLSHENSAEKKRRKGLGRGLEALLGPALSKKADDDSSHVLRSLSLDELVPGTYQPRTRMDEGALYELAQSIKAQGIMQPILVRALKVGSQGTHPRYEIIAGERRFQAAKLAGLKTVPVLVKEVPNEAAAAMALIENMQREDLNPLEEAQGLQRLIKEFGLSHEQAAQAVGRSRSATSNLLRLLQLAKPVQGFLLAGDLEMGHARALLPLDKTLQMTAANEVVAKKMSVRQTEAWVKKHSQKQQNQDKLTVPVPLTAQTENKAKQLAEELAKALATKVEIFSTRKNKGQITDANQVGKLQIAFTSLAQLQCWVKQLKLLST